MMSAICAALCFFCLFFIIFFIYFFFFLNRQYGPSDRPQSTEEKYFLGLDISKECPDLPAPANAMDAARNAISFYSKIQSPDGHWANDYGGPMFLMPGLIVACYITGTELPKAHKQEIIVYLLFFCFCFCLFLFLSLFA
jgi:hypothetical protein